MNKLYLLVAIFPIYVICSYIYNKDKEKEPIDFLIKLLIYGVLSSIFVVLINIVLNMLDIKLIDINNASTKDILFYCFISIALLEEVSKFIFLYISSYKSKNYDYTFDMIVYGAFVSLGFALFENIIYVQEYGIKVGFQRSGTAIVLHACCGIIMGMYLGSAKIKDLNNKKSKYLFIALSIIVPTLIHGMYDYCALTKSLYNLILIVMVISTSSIIFVNYNKARDRKIKDVKEIS